MLALKLAPQVYSCFNNWSRQSSRKAFSARDLNCFEPDKRRYKKKPVNFHEQNWWIRWFDIKRFPKISNPSCNSLKIYILHWAKDLRSCAAPGFFFEDPPPPLCVATAMVLLHAVSRAGRAVPAAVGNRCSAVPKLPVSLIQVWEERYIASCIFKKGKHKVLFPCSSGRNLWIHGSSFYKYGLFGCFAATCCRRIMNCHPCFNSHHCHFNWRSTSQLKVFSPVWVGENPQGQQWQHALPARRHGLSLLSALDTRQGGSKML